MTVRRNLAVLLGAFAIVVRVSALRGEAGWKVTVMGDPGDPRVAAVREAVAFWNTELERVGAAARLGPVQVVENSVPEDVLSDLSRAVADGRGARGLGRWLGPDAGPFTVVLSGKDLMSFGIPRRSGAGGVVVLRSAATSPLSLPNVARNVAAHELGHLLGLEHNSDPGTLMCGRPAPCRPDAFASGTPRFFPLTPADESSLLQFLAEGRLDERSDGR